MSSTAAALRPDATTLAVREFYELFPYPASGTPALRSGFDARFVLSLGRLDRPVQHTLAILDAGCGRGVGLVTCAKLHPEAQVTGIDLCRPALEEAAEELIRRGLMNARVDEVDLMTLEGLEVPEGGFDLIYSSGVVHHLSDPLEGLRKLGEVLAPHGVIVFMIYGEHGRAGYTRVARALTAYLDPGEPLPERLTRAKELTRELADPTDPECPFHQAARVPDAEFVDRYLHPNDVNYDVPGLFDLVDDAGLAFLCWADPELWSVERWFPEGSVRDAVLALPERRRYELIEQLALPARHELYLGKPENGPRVLPPLEEWGELLFAAHPEVQFEVGTRNLWGKSRIETVAYRRRDQERVELGPGPLRTAVWILATQNQPFRGVTLLQALTEQGVPPAEAYRILERLQRMELVYTPHAEHTGFGGLA